jgi:hypothetical protein
VIVKGPVLPREKKRNSGTSSSRLVHHYNRS